MSRQSFADRYRVLRAVTGRQGAPRAAVSHDGYAACKTGDGMLHGSPSARQRVDGLSEEMLARMRLMIQAMEQSISHRKAQSMQAKDVAGAVCARGLFHADVGQRGVAKAQAEEAGRQDGIMALA